MSEPTNFMKQKLFQKNAALQCRLYKHGTRLPNVKTDLCKYCYSLFRKEYNWNDFQNMVNKDMEQLKIEQMQMFKKKQNKKKEMKYDATKLTLTQMFPKQSEIKTDEKVKYSPKKTEKDAKKVVKKKAGKKTVKKKVKKDGKKNKKNKVRKIGGKINKKKKGGDKDENQPDLFFYFNKK